MIAPMIESTTPLTLDEYREATEDVRRLHSKIVTSNRAALRRQISKLSTLNGKIEQTETARVEAEALIGSTTRAYAAVALAQALTRWNDPPGTGEARLRAATAEATGKAQADPDAPRIAKRTEPAPHGTDRRYRAGCSCWACRKAHAGTQRRYRVARERRENEARISEEALDAA